MARAFAARFRNRGQSQPSECQILRGCQFHHGCVHDEASLIFVEVRILRQSIHALRQSGAIKCEPTASHPSWHAVFPREP